MRSPLRMWRLVALVVSILLVLWLAAPAGAVPLTPYSPWGTILVNGVAPADGTEVTAWIGGVKYATTVSTNGGWYAIDVPSDDDDSPEKDGGVAGETVVLMVGACTAEPSGSWSSGASPRIDLAADRPGQPALSSPADGSGTCDSTPIFAWVATSGATSYQLQVDDDPGFGSPEIDEITSETSFTPAASLAPGTYYWHVQASNPCGASAWSEVWDLTMLSCAPPATVGVSPDSGFSAPGTLLTFSSTYSDLDGWDDLRDVYLRLNTTESLTNCVYLRYDVQANRMWIRRPDDGAWQGGGTLGVAGTIRNTYVTLDYGLSSVATDTNTVTVTWAFTPTYRNSGKLHNLYLLAEGLSGQTTGWVDHGDWIINRDPSLIPPPVYNRVTLAASPAKWTLDPRYKDLDGRLGLTTCYYALVDSPPTGEMGAGGIYLKYDQVENKMYLANTTGTDWGEGVAPGTADAYLTNDAVKVIVQFSSIGSNGAKELIVRWRVAFDPDFAGTHKVYMRTLDQFPEADGDTGWAYKGWLTVAP